MSDIIFHIGFPKCASSTLQSKVFKNEKGYLGTAINKNNFANELREISPAGPKVSWSKKELRRWSDRVASHRHNNFPNEKRLICSSEMLSNRNVLDEYPIIEFLEYFDKHVWKEGCVKILLVIRNPADRIASEYAQISYSKPEASQNDFEKYLSKKLKAKKQVNYAKWITKLNQSFGSENVCVLVMEDIQTISFWKELKEFCQIDKTEPEKIVTDTTPKNKRSTRENHWNIRPYDSSLAARSVTIKVFGIFWPISILSALRKKMFYSFEELIFRYNEKKYNSVIGQDRGSIHLTLDMRNQIAKKFSKQTAHLSKLLNRDMKSLGY